MSAPESVRVPEKPVRRMLQIRETLAHSLPHRTEKPGLELIRGLSYTRSGEYLASCNSDGSISIFYFNEANRTHRKMRESPPKELPTNCIKWCPVIAARGSFSLATANSNGGVDWWDWKEPSGDQPAELARSYQSLEEGNETMAIDYSPHGALLASVGSDRRVRVYDTVSLKVTNELTRATDDQGFTSTAHTNRIFSVRFASNDILLSGGWNNPVHVWDLRTGRSERHLSGVRMCSDGLEIVPNTTHCIVTSHRDRQQLMMFDFMRGIEIVDETQRLSAAVGTTCMYASRFCDATKSIWSVGTAPDVLFNIDLKTGAVNGAMDCPEHSFVALDLNSKNPQCCTAGGFGNTIVSVEASPLPRSSAKQS